MENFNIEVEYTYKGERTWTYFFEKRKSLETAIKSAKKSYDSRIRDLGWGKYVILIHVKQIRNWDDKPTYKPFDDSYSSGGYNPASKRKSTKPKSNRKAPRKSTGSNGRVAASNASSKKPRANRKDAGTTVRSKPKSTTTSRGRRTKAT